VNDVNGVMLQFFHWFLPADGTLWRRLEERAEELADAGFTAVWLPPACKGAGGASDVGYAVYDIFDLGEFDQKGSVRTKYGTKDEYLRAIRAAQTAGVQVYSDVVLNHRLGGDEPEEFSATPMDPRDRTKPIGEPRRIRAWTHFRFPGRGGEYSTLEWHWWHFNAVDRDENDPELEAVYLFEGKSFQQDVDLDFGNYDYLLGCNVDIQSGDARAELLHWGRWYVETTGVDGFRFDAAKHVRPGFFLEWLEHVRAVRDRDLFAVGEYWTYDRDALRRFRDRTDGRVALFDTILHDNLVSASQDPEGFDLRTLFDGTLVQEDPTGAVTLVTNHDTQPLQTNEAVVEPWFVPLAYALVLLREGGYPVVFLADYDGAEYEGEGRDGQPHHVVMPSHRWLIDRFLRVRRERAYGEQRDYFEEPRCIGWVRTGDEQHPGGAAVVLSSGEPGARRMQTASPRTEFVDVTGHVEGTVTTEDDGWAEFRCAGGSVSVWVPAFAWDG
jgi:alpha-amylase